MWGRMTGEGGYVAPFEIDEPMSGHAVGTVIESRLNALPVGTVVLHEAGWREYAVLDGDQVRALPPGDYAASHWLGILGQTGFTAYVGLLEIARCRPGDVVFVSAAAGAVGSTAVQIARALGCRVVASAGAADKVAHVREVLGADQAFSYRDGPVKQSLGEALEAMGEDGIDVYFDNVAGEHLEAALRYMNVGGRIAMCGAISTLTAGGAAGPRNLLRAIWQRVHLQGFIVGDHERLRPAFERAMQGWLERESVCGTETTVVGIEGAFDGFLALLAGRTLGKAVVRLPRAR